MAARSLTVKSSGFRGGAGTWRAIWHSQLARCLIELSGAVPDVYGTPAAFSGGTPSM